MNAFASGPRGICLVVGLCLSVVAGCKRGEFTETQYLADANARMDKADFAAAVVDLKGALSINPKNRTSRLLLADAYLKQSRGIDAEIEIKRAESLGASRVQTILPLGNALLTQGDFNRLLVEIKTDADYSPALAAQIDELRGEAQWALRQKDNATKSFNQALASDPTVLDATIGLAQIAVADHDLPKGASQVAEVLSKSPDNLRALLLEAEIQRYGGKLDDALATYDRILAKYPQNVIALSTAAYIDLVNDHADVAQKKIEALRKAPGAAGSADYLQALVEFRKKNFSAARDAIQKALVALPSHLPSNLLAGAIEFQLGNYEHAESLLRQVVGAAPATLYAREMLVATLLKLNRPAQAIEQMQPLLGPQVVDPRLLSLAGVAYMQNRDYAHAADLFGRAAAVDPKDTNAQFRLGLSRVAGGDAERGLGDLQAAVDLDPANAGADFVLIITQLRRGDYQRALDEVQALEKRQPDNPLTYNLKGGALLAMKDAAGARAAFEKSLALDPAFVPAAMNLARIELQDKHPDLAKQRLRTILDKDSKNVEAMMALAAMLEALGEPGSESVALLERARATDPRAVEPRLRLASALLSQDPKRAVVVAREANAIDPDNPVTLDALASAQVAVGEKAGALATYNQLIQLRPDSATAQLRLALLSIDSGNASGAERALQTALKLKPNYLEAQALLVALDLAAGHVDGAMAIAKTVQKQLPNQADGLVLEGDVLMKQAHYLPAAAVYEKAFSLSRNNVLAMRVYAALKAGGRQPEADAVLQRWLKDMPDDLETRAYYANQSLRNQQFKTAQEQYEIVLQKKPDTVMALNDLAWLYGRSKDSRAIPTAEHAYQLRSDEPHVADTYGWLLVQSGDLARGTEVLRQAANANPSAVTLRFHLGQAYAKAGNTAGAKQQFEFIVNTKVDGPERRDAAIALAAYNR